MGAIILCKRKHTLRICVAENTKLSFANLIVNAKIGAKNNGISNINKLSKDIAEKVLEDLEVNDMPLSEFLVKVDGVADFLKREIRICKERLQDDKSNPFYDGVGVGVKEARKLTLNHIQFCKKLLEMMNFEE